MDGGDVLSYDKVENPNRYPVETYKWGYTYRATDDFKRRYEVERFRHVRARRRHWDRDEDYWGRRHWERRNKDYYYKWSRRLESYVRVDCYHSAPEGKLFYRKCV
jgi:hypothetical protein